MNSLNTELCWLYSFFLYWFFPYASQSSQIIFKILFSNIWKIWLNLHLCGRDPIKSILFFCPSVSLLIHLQRIFLRVHSVDFLNFLNEDMLSYILKSDKARFRKILFCCLDNWVNKTNLDQKRNIRYFNEGSITFCTLNDAP